MALKPPSAPANLTHRGVPGWDTRRKPGHPFPVNCVAKTAMRPPRRPDFDPLTDETRPSPNGRRTALDLAFDGTGPTLDDYGNGPSRCRLYGRGLTGGAGPRATVVANHPWASTTRIDPPEPGPPSFSRRPSPSTPWPPSSTAPRRLGRHEATLLVVGPAAHGRSSCSATGRRRVHHTEPLADPPSLARSSTIFTAAIRGCRSRPVFERGYQPLVFLFSPPSSGVNPATVKSSLPLDFIDGKRRSRLRAPPLSLSSDDTLPRASSTPLTMSDLLHACACRIAERSCFR